MVHTLPDYTTKYRLTRFFATIDDAELAARLGSINTFDRRGNVVFIDDFSGNISGWLTSTDGAGGYARKDWTHSYKNDAVLLLYPGINGQTQADVERRFYLPQDTPLGLEWIYSTTAATNTIIIKIEVYTGAVKQTWQIRVDYAGDKFEVWDNANWVDITGGSYDFALATDQFFGALKVVVDPTTQKYVRLLFAEKEYDISSHVCQSGASSTQANIYVTFIVTNSAGNPAKTRLAGFIFTQNEPL